MSKKPSKIDVTIKGFDLLSSALSEFPEKIRAANEAFSKLAPTIDGAGNTINQQCVHQWESPVGSIGNTLQCFKCGYVWVPVNSGDAEQTPAGQLAFQIANKFRVTVSEAEHVVKCVKMNIVPSPLWNTVRNEHSKVTQVTHVSGAERVMWINHETLKVVDGYGSSHREAGSTIHVPAPNRYKPKTKTVKSPNAQHYMVVPVEPIEREIIEPTARVVMLPDEDE